MILEKYKIDKTLGRGPYGKVFLTLFNSNRYAIKQLSKQNLQTDPDFQQYLQEQLKAMQYIQSPHVMKVLEKAQDNSNIYLICEYCNKGNLVNYQESQLKGEPFSIQKTTLAASHIILGLLQMHSFDLLYKGIKPQNILVQVKQNNTEIFKLADFGFSKNTKQKLIGQVNKNFFMAPQRFQVKLDELEQQNQKIGYGIDIWALGVTMFWMLNKQYPFNLGDNATQNSAKLKQQCFPFFDYKKAVAKTAKKLQKNATPQIIDLFKRIFKIQTDHRIDFHQIKKHNLFKKHFSDTNITDRSYMVYKQSFQSKIVQRRSKIQASKIEFGKNKKVQNKSVFKKIDLQQGPQKQDSVFMPSKAKQIKQEQLKNIREIDEQDDEARGMSAVDQPLKSIKFEKQLKQFIFQKERNDLLLFFSEYFMQDIQGFTAPLKYSLRFYTLKLYIIYTRILKKKYDSKQIPEGCNNYQFKWNQFFKSEEYNLLVKKLGQNLKDASSKYEKVYKQCSSKLNIIQSKIKHFSNSFTKDIIQTQFNGQFKLAYRATTSLCYGIIAKLLENQNNMTKPNIIKLYLIQIGIFICHCFNRIFQKSDVQQIFANYFKWKNNKKIGKQFDFRSFRDWLEEQSRQNLKKTTQIIIGKYFRAA